MMGRTKKRSGMMSWIVGALVVCGCPAVVAAHVTITNPIDEAVIDAGDIVSVQWMPNPPHDTLFWHVELSDDSGVSWDPVALDVAPELLAYEWTVPDIDCPACLLRVTQDNSATDYDDTIQITIVGSSTADAGVDASSEVADAGVDASSGAADADLDGGAGGDDGGGCAVGPRSSRHRFADLFLLLLIGGLARGRRHLRCRQLAGQKIVHIRDTARRG